MNVEDTSLEGSEGNESQREGDFCYVVAENLVGLCPKLVLEAKFVEELGYLAEMISKQILKVRLGFFLLLTVKMQEERDKLIDLLAKKKPELDLRDSQHMQMVKDANIGGFVIRKAYSRDEGKGFTG